MVASVLVVDDDESVSGVVRAILEPQGYQVERASDLTEAAEKLLQTRFDVLLVAPRVGQGDGLAVLSRFRAVRPSAAAIVLTADDGVANAAEVMRAGADDFVLKPWDAAALKASIARAMHWRARLEGQGDAAGHESDARVRALEELNQLKEDFIATAGHDLKSPLTAIRGHAQLLLRRIRAPQPDLDQIAASLEVVDAQASAMTRLVDDLLDVSRIQAGAFELRIAPCDLGACLKTVLARLGPGERDRVALTVPDVPLAGAWDRKRVEQVIANLVGNALKYSSKRTRVRVAIQARDGEVEVAVKDRGMGIPAAELPRLFARFHRTPQAKASSLSGSGLGLYIARGIVEAHAGHIRAESPGEGQGSTFRFTLPTEQVVRRVIGERDA